MTISGIYCGRTKADAAASKKLWRSYSSNIISVRIERTKKPLDDLQEAIVGMFNYMNLAFDGIEFEPQNNMEYLIGRFLTRFDAIFTLNQDLLLERHYLNGNIALTQPRKWNGCHLPGIKPFNPSAQGFDPTPAPARMQTIDDPANFKEQPGMQPYYKLHGSTNWIGGDGGQRRLLIMGGNKAVEIIQYPLLACITSNSMNTWHEAPD
jgi:hypothetical protein